jgi:transposase-like protein
MIHIPNSRKQMMGATIQTIFVQPDVDSTRTQLRQVVELLETRYPKAAELLAEYDVTAYAKFPQAHWSKISSTNPLERVNISDPELRVRPRVGRPRWPPDTKVAAGTPIPSTRGLTFW